MELKIKTTVLQDMVGRAIQCSSNNKLIPLTSLMSVRVKNGILTLTTTDASNYFYVSSEEKVDCEDFEVSILAELFTKLVQKTTSEIITLSINEGIFNVAGNGNYKIELPLDENGGVIKFPNKLPAMEPPVSGTIKLSTVNFILKYNKPSLAVSMELPSITCYYCGDKVVTSDRFKVCTSDIKVFDKPALITPQVMELLSVMSEENINYSVDDKEMIFWDKNNTVYSNITEGIETFPYDAIMGFVNGEFKSRCKVSRTAVLDVLDRLSLFVSPYDKKGINLTFTKDGIMFSSKKSSGTELVPYISNDNFEDYTCCIDVEMLKTQVNTQEGESLDISYGSPMAIRLVYDNVTQIVALMQEAEV